MCLCLSARVCKHLPIYYNTVTTISGTTYGSFAKIECFDGTRMFDGSTSKTLYCDALGEWNGAGSDCNGKHKMLCCKLGSTGQMAFPSCREYLNVLGVHRTEAIPPS